jgi:hypothetical protein
MENVMPKNIPDAKEIKKYSKEARDTINKIVAAERNKKLEKDTKNDKALVEEYYDLKDKLLEIIGAAGKSQHNDNKRLKIIANMPARRPSSPKGYATAAQRINKGTLSKTKNTTAISVIVEEKEGKVEARKLAPRKKATAKKVPVSKKN